MSRRCENGICCMKVLFLAFEVYTNTHLKEGEKEKHPRAGSLGPPGWGPTCRHPSFGGREMAAQAVKDVTFLWHQAPMVPAGLCWHCGCSVFKKNQVRLEAGYVRPLKHDLFFASSFVL